MIAVLMITYNRLDFTKKALGALVKVKGADITVIDNGSKDGTQNWLLKFSKKANIGVVFLSHNEGVAGAMNVFLHITKKAEFVGKVDNDTIVPPDFIERMLPHMIKADLVQAKHPILKATHPGGFDEWVKTMKQDGPLRFNHFVGGSGILFKRNIVDRIPETEWMLGGFRQWQREHPEYKKAFATDVEIELLDTDEAGANYDAYPEYYVETKRL